jgi:pyruvate kinase
MLDSMIRSPRPTRAEAADVANAVLDATDVVMLSGETASGRYPLEAVRMMDAIVREVEASELARGAAPAASVVAWSYASACAAAAAVTSRNTRLAGVVVFTRSGHTADQVAEFRPLAPIVAVVPTAAIAQRLALQWGIRPTVDPREFSQADAIERAEGVARELLGARAGDTVAIVVGSQRHGGTKAFILDTLGK